MKEILPYLENKNATFHAIPRVATPPDAVLIAFVSFFTSLQPCQCNVAKMIKILDLFTFHAEPHKDQILYKDWHLQMLNKISANELFMPTEALKLAYI